MTRVTIADAIHSLKIEIENQLEDNRISLISTDVMAYNIKEIADLIGRLDDEPDHQVYVNVLENPMGGFYYTKDEINDEGEI